MTRVAFTIIGGKTKWMGGINYLKNLLYAISKLEDRKISPVLFVGKKIDKKLLSEFEGLAEIKRDSLFDRYSLKWFIDIILRDLFKINPLINSLVKTHQITVFSHSFVYGIDLRCISVNWMPDFQHIRLPHMFSKINIVVRSFRLKALAKHSNSIILSSHDALKDLQHFAPRYSSKGSVINFVSQTTAYENRPVQYLYDKYKFQSKYYFLPNQFWAHKNHQTAFEAILLAKQQQPDILLICSGQMEDERNPGFITGIKKYIIDNKLEGNIFLLGLIPFNDVLLLMKHSVSIINPSFFEGWSSTVEEAKSMNKSLILSNIPVHIEQAPDLGSFFNPAKAEELSNLLIEKWNDCILKLTDSDNIEKALILRTQEFGKQYQSLILKNLKII